MKLFRISVVVLLVAFLWTLTGCKGGVKHGLTDRAGNQEPGKKEGKTNTDDNAGQQGKPNTAGDNAGQQGKPNTAGK
jgi:hypothetical protein